MSFTDKVNRLKEALKSEKDPDIIVMTKAIIQGITYLYLRINSKIAKLRFDNSCKSCEFNVIDPVESMREEDDQVPEASGRMCSHCGGCVLSYKLRQNVKPCEYWKDQIK